MSSATLCPHVSWASFTQKITAAESRSNPLVNIDPPSMERRPSVLHSSQLADDFRKLLLQKYGSLHTAFKYMDTWPNGLISHLELELFMTSSLNLRDGRKRAHELFIALDADEDGKLSIWELLGQEPPHRHAKGRDSALLPGKSEVDSMLDNSALEDSIDIMLKSSQDTQRPNHQQQQQHHRQWQVSDDELEEYVKKLAMAQEIDTQQNANNSKDKDRQHQHQHGVRIHLQHLERSVPVPDVHSGRRHIAVPREDEFINIYVRSTTTGDRVMLHVHPDTRLGPDKELRANRFTDMFGTGASTKGFDQGNLKYDYKNREFAHQKADVPPAWKECLKSMIEEAMGVPVSKQRLFFNGLYMTIDDKTLRSYDIINSVTLQLITRSEPFPTSRRTIAEDASQGSSPRKGELAPSRLLPKWISQNEPKLFGVAPAVHFYVSD